MTETHRRRFQRTPKCAVQTREVGNTLFSGGIDLSNTKPTALLSNEADHRVEVLESLIHAPAHRFGERHFTGPGVYALLYRGDLACYRRLRRPSGDSGSIVVSGGFPIYVGSSAHSLAARVGDHRCQLATATDLDPSEFLVIQLETESPESSLYAEAILIAETQACWNQRWIAGVGSKSRGTVRSRAKKSPWSLFHQEGSQGDDIGFDAMTKAAMATRISAHLAVTVPTAATCEIPRPRRLQLIDDDYFEVGDRNTL